MPTRAMSSVSPTALPCSSFAASWLTAAAAAILVGALLLDHPANTEIAHATTWQTEAVMPPPEQPSTTGELVAVAQWMASDLAPGDATNSDVEH